MRFEHACIVYRRRRKAASLLIAVPLERCSCGLVPEAASATDILGAPSVMESFNSQETQQWSVMLSVS